nr:XRE family transcriptional regulator [Roseomonas aerilata]
MLGWPEWKVAHRARCSVETLRTFATRTRRPRAATLAAIRAALEEAGVIFVDENGGGPGVRLRNRNA